MNIGGLSLKREWCYGKEGLLSALRKMVVYSRRKNKRNYLHLVSQMPKRKKNNFRAFEPIVVRASGLLLAHFVFEEF
jgi:hypothetical protein